MSLDGMQEHLIAYEDGNIRWLSNLYEFQFPLCFISQRFLSVLREEYVQNTGLLAVFVIMIGVVPQAIIFQL